MDHDTPSHEMERQQLLGEIWRTATDIYPQIVQPGLPLATVPPTHKKGGPTIGICLFSGSSDTEEGVTPLGFVQLSTFNKAWTKIVLTETFRFSRLPGSEGLTVTRALEENLDETTHDQRQSSGELAQILGLDHPSNEELNTLQKMMAERVQEWGETHVRGRSGPQRRFFGRGVLGKLLGLQGDT